MAGYTRQSSFADGDIIQAADFNDEYNQLLNAFNNTTGHAHDGTAAEGPVIGLIGDPGVAAPINKVVVDDTNNRVGLFIDAGGLGSSVEQLRFQDGVIVPVTNNDIDLGTSGAKFKDLYLAGDANIAGTMTLSGNVIVSGTLGADLIPDADDTRDIGSSGAEWKDLYIDGVAYIDSIAMPTTTVTDILDEDTMTSDSATALATQQSIKAYVDAQVTAQDLDVAADTGTAAVDLDSQSLTVTGGTGIDTSATGQAVTVAIDSTVATLTDTQTLTNKTIDAANNTVSNINTTMLASGVLDTDLTSVSASDDTIPSAKATKAYVDAQVTAQDLDFQADTGGALNIDLDSETLTFTGGTGIDTSGAGNAVTFAIDSTVATLTGTQTLTNKTLTSAVLNGTISGTSIKDEDSMVSNSATHLATQQSIKAYVDSQVTAQDLDITTDSGTIAIDLDSETLTVAGTANEIETSATGNIVTIGLPNDITVSGTATATTFSGDLNGTINTATTATTQAAGTNNTTVATTAFANVAADNAAVALAIALG